MKWDFTSTKMDEVFFFKENTSFTLNHIPDIKDWIKEVINKEDFTLLALNIIFCDDEYLLSVNQKYLNHDYYTDIITFDNSENTKEVEGDIFISIDRVKENANKLNALFDHELHRVIIHGTLHLLGYNDKEESEKLIMRKKEDSSLSLRKFIS